MAFISGDFNNGGHENVKTLTWDVPATKPSISNVSFQLGAASSSMVLVWPTVVKDSLTP